MQLKKMLRKKAEKLCFYELCQNASTSTKTKMLRYDGLRMQDFLKSGLLSPDEMSVMVALRSRCLRGVKENFRNMHKVCLHCPLQCSVETPALDTQEHLLECPTLGGSTADMDFLHASPVEQSFLAKEVLRLMGVREQLLERADARDTCCRLPGDHLDQCTLRGAAAIL